MTKKVAKKKTKKSSKKQTNKNKNIFIYLAFAFLSIALIAVCGIMTNIHLDENGIDIQLTPSSTQVPAVIEGDQGELIEIEGIPTYEEIDGGQFMDISEMEDQGEYHDLGWSETYNVSSPEAFKNDTLNKCIYANNYYGAQCVSLARVFWWSYADRDVSTCGTGMAKGMMNCADENAGNDFLVYWSDDKNFIQSGDWLVFNGGQFGHVGMALGPVVNNYVALLGENQGGMYCEKGGSATNIVNINIKNLIGYYRPKAYVKPEPEPEPTPVKPTTLEYTYHKGDYFSKVLVTLGLDEGHLWGADGTVAYYTEQLIKQEMLDSNGNVKIGIPFTLTRR